MIIEPVHQGEQEHLLDLAVQTGLFTRDDAEGLLGNVLEELFAGALPIGHAAVACRNTKGEPASGWACFAPDPYADQVWNLWWIGVAPENQGSGAGSALLAHAESSAAEAGARLLIIQTSDQPPMARARRFYEKSGYSQRGTIPQFYSENEAKIIFSRTIAREAYPFVQADAASRRGLTQALDLTDNDPHPTI